MIACWIHSVCSYQHNVTGPGADQINLTEKVQKLDGPVAKSCLSMQVYLDFIWR
jgi:hypothetical protein